MLEFSGEGGPVFLEAGGVAWVKDAGELGSRLGIDCEPGDVDVEQTVAEALALLPVDSMVELGNTWVRRDGVVAVVADGSSCAVFSVGSWASISLPASEAVALLEG
tara:strand:+ start:716 stop:1033 length:318 start_codon:yes stop_codon:yes gene_type:complete